MVFKKGQSGNPEGRKKGSRNKLKSRKKKKLICLQCGNEFERYIHDIESGDVKYCSKMCKDEARKVKMPPKDVLYKKYWLEELSTTQLGKEFSVSSETISNWMKRMGISRRSVSEGVSIAQIGVKHSLKWNKAISRGQKNMKPEIRRKKVLATLNCNRNYRNRSKGGIRSDIKIYVRSSWEANICRYLNWLKGKNKIKEWAYEVETFEFPLKRGTRFYTPDFKIIENDGSVLYWEVKGLMDSESKTRLKRFKKYHPKEFSRFQIIIENPYAESKENGEVMKFLLDDLDIEFIDIISYKEIEEKLGALIPGWE